jgi:hypothetical protein
VVDAHPYGEWRALEGAIADFSEAIRLDLTALLVSLSPVIRALRQKVELAPPGEGIEQSPHFTEAAKTLLIQHYSKSAVTIVAAVTAILLAFHKGLKVEDNLKAYRHGESEFYDLYRRLLDRPDTFGAVEVEQLATYFDEVERARRFVRNAETDNLATVDDARAQLEQLRKKMRVHYSSGGQVNIGEGKYAIAYDNVLYHTQWCCSSF